MKDCGRRIVSPTVDCLLDSVSPQTKIGPKSSWLFDVQYMHFAEFKTIVWDWSQSNYSLIVKADIFCGFKDDQSKFKASLINDVTGMLSSYDAAHLGIRGERYPGWSPSFHCFSPGINGCRVGPQLSDEMLHALNRPIRRGLPRLEAMYHIELYSRDDSKHKALLKFVKLDLSIITEWWKNLDVETDLPYARNSVVECYFECNCNGIRFRL